LTTIPLLKRTTFICADAKALADFYQSVFEARRWYDHELEVDARFPPTGLADGAPARLIILQVDDPAVGMLGLLQYLAPPDDWIRPTPPADGRLRIGDAVLVWNVPDVDATHLRAVAAGAIISAPPTDWTVPAREGSGVTRLRMMALFDPEGHYLEVSAR